MRSKSSGTFIIGTEVGVVDILRNERPDLKVLSLGEPKVCVNMKLTTLGDVRNALLEEIHEIVVEDNIRKRALRAIERMVEI